MVSFLSEIVSVLIQSKALREDSLSYMMSKMTANSKWIPFQKFFLNRDMRKCIDFDNIAVQYPAGLSKVTGFYQKVKFKFSDTTLKIFAYDLNAWIKNSTEIELGEMKQCKLRFSISANTLKNVKKRV